MVNEREIFVAALEIDDPDARVAFLQTVCGGDAELQARVQSLLESAAVEDSFLDTPAPDQVEACFNPTIAMPTGSTDDFAEHSNPHPTLPEGGVSHEGVLSILEPPQRPGSFGRLAHYEFLEVIGRGAFGTVLKAFDEKLQRVVAIKMLAPELATTSPPRKRFLREARTSAKIRHENVVGIYAVEDDPTPYLVMEYIPGRTLQRRLGDQGPFELLDALQVGKQILDGLTAAHEEGLIHRDIKPGNILLEESLGERVKITDFGLARTVDDASMTQSGVIAGTPMYMAPEQVEGEKLDQRADLFSVGSVLYQMLTGRPPFRASTTMAVLKRVIDDTPRSIQEVIPEIPDWMCEIVGHLHAKNPADRYQSAQQVSEILTQCLTELQADRKPKIPKPNAPLPDANTIVETPQKPKSPLGRLFAKAAVFVLMLLLGLGITEATGVTQISSTVIRLATGSGSVIETNGPGDKIQVNGETITHTKEPVTVKPEADATTPKSSYPVGSMPYVLTSDEYEWTEAVNLAEVNSPDEDDMPWISEDGLTLLFASNRKGGIGASDL